MKYIIILLSVMISLMACQSKPEKISFGDGQTDSAEDDIRKIDVHSHYRYSRGYLPTLYKRWNMRSVLVDVAREDSSGLSRSWDPYLLHARAHPDLFFLCSSLIGTGIDDPDYAKNAIEQLSQEIDSGARMVKVWKNFGMVTKDAAGNFIQIDDVRLQPIWDFLKTQEIPVMAHIGEPEQAWRALDPGNPHYGYYKNNPQYHAYKIPEIPSYETIISARDRWLKNNPDLQFLCAHLGSMSHDIDMVAERLDKFPHMHVELAARFGDLASQDSEKVRVFFKKYQDRIMFGSDYGNSKPEDTMTEAELKEEETHLNASYEKLWKYLSSTDSLEVRGQKTVGLGLPPDIIQKVYYQNTANFLKL